MMIGVLLMAHGSPDNLDDMGAYLQHVRGGRVTPQVLVDDIRGRYQLIGDVRGFGLFIGVELVLDRETLIPAADQASYIVNRLRDHGILFSTDGPLHNIIKTKPPLVFNKDDADRVVNTLDKILKEDFVRI